MQIKLSPLIIAAWTMLNFSASASASTVVFSDGFDDLSNWSVAAQADTVTEIVDYSLLSIPEAPNRVPGSAATTAVRFQANLTSGVPSAINLIGTVAGGNAALSTPTYHLEFDMWLNTSDPLPATGSTEQGVWGIGRTNNTVLSGNNILSDGDGTFGWLAVENGYSREDTVVFSDTSEQGRKDGSTHRSLFDSAFDRTVAQPGPNTANAAANQWVQVTITANQGTVEVSYNGVSFFSIDNVPTIGNIMVGYDDPFASVSSVPAEQFGIIDNVVVTVPEPGTLVLLAVGVTVSMFNSSRQSHIRSQTN